jgi:hypothetical protein
MSPPALPAPPAADPPSPSAANAAKEMDDIIAANGTTVTSAKETLTNAVETANDLRCLGACADLVREPM